VSFWLDSPTDGVIIVLISRLLGFWPKAGAAAAKQQLLAAVELRTTGLRDVLPGDVVVMTATLLLYPVRRWGRCSAACRYPFLSALAAADSDRRCRRHRAGQRLVLPPPSRIEREARWHRLQAAGSASAELAQAVLTAAGNTGSSCRSDPHLHPRLISTAAA
jgi:hypothetical protein